MALALANTALARPVSAQEAQPIAQSGADRRQADTDQIVVIAERLPGQVQTDVPPVVELNEAEIAAYGATSVADLVAQLAPQTGSSRGRGGGHVFLVNGQRISNFRELSRFPPEAIRKVEVLPEEVALKFGFAPDARVINFILQENFVSREVEAEFGMPTAGGYGAAQLEASLLSIAGARRINAGIDYQRTSPLTEGERGIEQSIAAAPAVIAAGLDPADFRTLVARSESVTANATMTQGLGEMGAGGQVTLTGEVLRSVTNSLSGIDAIELTPIERRTKIDTYSLGGGYNRQLGDWRFSTTLDANHTDSDSRRDESAGSGADRALSATWTADLKTTLAGTPLRLPAGDANLTLDTGYKWNKIAASGTPSGASDASFDRSGVRAGFNLGVPLASRREGVLAAIGDLSLNLSGGVDRLSDFGTLTNWNAGVVWSPAERLGLQASVIAREVAPGLSQLGAPRIVDVNVPVYDFASGRTVLASVTTGGNLNLLAETQRDLKLSASYDLDLFERANLLVEYNRNRSSDTTESFPLLTPATEAAFPGRVTRAADGTLLAIDRRPVTFAQRSSSRIRYGFNLFGRLGKPSPQAQGGRGPFAAVSPAQAPAPVADTSPRAPGGGGFGGGGGLGDPARFAEMRAKFCSVPEGRAPDLTGVPERMLERLKGPDGQIDPAKVAVIKARLCAADGAAPGGPPRTPMTPEQFVQLRTGLGCGDSARAPDLASIPAPILERMKGSDGQVDPARLTEFRQRICAMPVPKPGAGPGAGAAAHGGPPGPVVAVGPGGGRGGRGGGAGGPVGGGPRGGGPGGGPRGALGGMFGGGDGQGRWNLSMYHTVELSNRALIASTGPALDLLDGDALSESGLSRHRVELEGGLFKDGLGARLSANYRSGSLVRGSGLPGSSDLRFGGLATFNLRLFANLAQQKWLTGPGEAGFWKGARLGLGIENVLDAQQRVTDANGTVPLRYQPGLVDPRGRFVEIEFRKLF